MALNRQEETVLTGVTQAAFHFLLLREHPTAQPLWFPLLPSALVLRHPMGKAVQGKSAALHRTEGWHSNRLLKKGLPRLTFNPANTCMQKDKLFLVPASLCSFGRVRKTQSPEQAFP